MGKSLASRIFLWAFLLVGCSFANALKKSIKSSVPRATNVAQDTSYGTEFIIGFIRQNISINSTIVLAINAQAVDVSGSFTILGTSNTGFFNSFFQSIIPMPIPSSAPQGNGSFLFAIRITANTSSTVQFYLTDQSPGNSEGTLVFPNNVLGTSYVINTFPSGEGFAVVTVNNNTQVNVTFPDNTTATSVLNQFDILQNVGSNLAGSLVKANNSIGVFAGRNCINNTSGPCNYMLESLPSISQFGTDFIYVRPPVFINATVSSTFFRFVSSQNNTQITINNQTVVNLTNAFSVGNYSSNLSSFSIHSNLPIDVEVMGGYPSIGNQTQISLVPNNQFVTFAQLRPQSFSDPITQTLIIIARTEDINNAPQGLTINSVVVEITSFNATINPEFSFVALQPRHINSEVVASFGFVGYFYSVDQFDNLYASTVNRGFSTPL